MNTTEIQLKVVNDIIAERARQDKKWGETNHPLEWWLAILGEEVGEVNRAVLEYHFDNGTAPVDPAERKAQIREEIIHVAAVATAMAECMDREEL